MIKSNKQRTAGFSLIELSIAMVLAGLIAATSLQLYQLYRHTKVASDTQTRQETISTALGKYLVLKGRYPCPAAQFRTDGDTLYGREECPTSGMTAGTCTSSGGVNGVCVGEGGDNWDFDTAPNRVLIGAIPFAELGITMRDTLDGYGRRFTYMVSEEITAVPGTPGPDVWTPCGNEGQTCNFTGTRTVRYGVTDFAYGVHTNAVSCTNGVFGDPQPGFPKSCAYLTPGTNASTIHRQFAIRVVTQSFAADGTVSMVEPARDNHETPTSTADDTDVLEDVAIISHGENGVGAYTISGKLFKPCQGTGTEIENCDIDGHLIDPGTQLVLNKDSAQFSDDSINLDIWEQNNHWTADSSGDAHVYNRNASKVGIGTQEPEAMLDIIGNLRSDKILAERICNQDGEDCFEPGKIAGAGMNCPNGLVIGFEEGEAVCANTSGSTMGIPPLECPAGHLAYGIEASGNILCAVP